MFINLFMIKLYNILSTASFVDPILIMFFIAKGLSFTQIMSLTSIAYITVLLLEVPSGVLADKLGEKKILALGSIFNLLSVITFILFENYLFFIIGSVFSAFSSAFISGADSSYTYKIVVESENRNFEKFIGIVKSYSFYMMGLTSLIGGFIYSVNVHLPLILNGIIYTVSLVVLFLIKDPGLDGGIVNNNSSKTIIDILKGVKNSTIGNHVLIFLIIFSVSVAMFTNIGKSLTQPYMDSIGINIQLFGVIYFLANILAGIGSRFSYRLSKFYGMYYKHFILLSLTGLFFMMSFMDSYYGLVILLLFNVYRGFTGPYINSELNNIISDNRATILSFNSLLGSIVIAASSLVIGYIMDLYNVFITLRVVALTTVVFSILIALLQFKYNIKRSIEIG